MLNLTPHPITLRLSGDYEVTFRPSGTVARVSTQETEAGTYAGVPVMRRTFGEVTGLPSDGTPCIVSALVLSAVPGRKDTYAPDTGPTAIRNDQGQVVAVTRLIAA